MSEYKQVKYREIGFDYLLEPNIINLLKDNDVMHDVIALPRNGAIILYYLGKKLLEIKKCYRQFKICDKKSNESNESLNFIISNRNYEEVKNVVFKRKDFVRSIKMTTPEKRIQCEISKQYESDDSLIFIDMEYAQAFESQKEKDSNTLIKGRYDFIFLKKNVDKYNIVFVELKSKKSAYKDLKTGVINHMSDMQNYLLEYKGNKQLQKGIQIDINSVLSLRKDIGLKSINPNLIDYNNPEFWVLFKMVEDEEPPKSIKCVLKEELDSFINSGKLMNEKKVAVFGREKKSDYTIEELIKIIIKEKYKFFINNFAELL